MLNLNCIKNVFRIALGAVLLAFCLNAGAQEVTGKDTLTSVIYFPVAKSDQVYLDYAGNSERLQSLQEDVERARREGAVVTRLHLRGSASPEGSEEQNLQLSVDRAATARAYLIEYLDLPPSVIQSIAVGEDWGGLQENLLLEENYPWRDSVLTLLDNEAERKELLRQLEGGAVWQDLLQDNFLRLRAVQCYLEITYYKYEGQTTLIEKTDTVFVDVPYEVEKIVTIREEVPSTKKVYNTEGKKMLFALRTNILAVPFTNVGVEVPLGEHFSIGADWYSPWIWRERQKWGFNKEVPDKDRDTWGWCFEFQAADVEARYWFTNRKKQPEQRLLGHSIGLYAAAGHYDFEGFENKWTGWQGEFVNAGIDYLYAFPIFKGRMHMELELGVGYIYSKATPYECLAPGDVCYRIPGPRKTVNWFGPTRAQFSLVLPIYVKKRTK